MTSVQSATQPATGQQEKKKYESERQLERQQRVLKCARKMLNESGYDGLVMRQLAIEAGVARATLNNLYGSKDDLIVASVRDTISRITNNTELVDDPLQNILARLARTAEEIRATPRYTEAMARAMFALGAESELAKTLFDNATPFNRVQLERAREAGLIDSELDTEVIAIQLAANSWGMLLQWIMGRLTMQQSMVESERGALLILTAVASDTSHSQLRQRLLQLSQMAGGKLS